MYRRVHHEGIDTNDNQSPAAIFFFQWFWVLFMHIYCVYHCLHQQPLHAHANGLSAVIVSRWAMGVFSFNFCVHHSGERRRGFLRSFTAGIFLCLATAPTHITTLASAKVFAVPSLSGDTPYCPGAIGYVTHTACCVNSGLRPAMPKTTTEMDAMAGTAALANAHLGTSCFTGQLLLGAYRGTNELGNLLYWYDGTTIQLDTSCWNIGEVGTGYQDRVVLTLGTNRLSNVFDYSLAVVGPICEGDYQCIIGDRLCPCDATGTSLTFGAAARVRASRATLDARVALLSALVATAAEARDLTALRVIGQIAVASASPHLMVIAVRRRGVRSRTAEG